MSIKKEIDKLTRTQGFSRNITEAIDKYSGTDTKSKTIKEAISKLSGREEVLYTIYEEGFNPESGINVDLEFSHGSPKFLVFTVASLVSDYERVSNRVNADDVPNDKPLAFSLADGADATLEWINDYSMLRFKANNDFSYCKVEYEVK